MSRDIFLEQMEDAKGCGRPHGLPCSGSHDYSNRIKPIEGPITFDQWLRWRVSMLIGTADPLHELIQDAAARARLNMKARQL
jgi:hypothetical protein